MDKKPICITFAGPYGCSKSPVAQYLSCELGFPVYGNDPVRSEIKEDLLVSHAPAEELDRRAAPRVEGLIARRQSFIADMSNDRRWQRFLEHFTVAGVEYNIGVISFDLSEDFYRKLLAAKQYDLSDSAIKQYLDDHKQTAVPHEVIICHITDADFSDRLKLALLAARNFSSKA